MEKRPALFFEGRKKIPWGIRSERENLLIIKESITTVNR